MRVLVTSRKDKAFNPAKVLSVETAWTVFSSGSGPTFHSNTLPAYEFDLVSSLFLFTDVFSMILIFLLN